MLRSNNKSKKMIYQTLNKLISFCMEKERKKEIDRLIDGQRDTLYQISILNIN